MTAQQRYMNSRTSVWVGLGLAMLMLVGLGGVCRNDFVDYDDEGYVTRNPNVRAGLTGSSARWAFTTTQECHWHPLTWLSLEFDSTLYGLQPWGFHFSSLLLHAAATLLLFEALRRMTSALWASALAAALFAIHPLHVEPVAWVADRKDVLAGFFWSLALVCYVRYIPRQSRANLVLLTGAAALGLLAKSTMVALPFALLVFDVWPLRRWLVGMPASGRLFARPVLEKLPLIVLAGGAAGAAWYAQHRSIVGNPAEPFMLRCQNALVSIAAYVQQTVWPTGLIPFYPLPARGYSLAQIVIALSLVVAISALAWIYARKLPALAAGWALFLVALAPTLGIAQVLGGHARADRYAYVPLLGLFMAAAWLCAQFCQRSGRRARVVQACCVAVLATMAGRCANQVGYWHDSGVLWSHVLCVDPSNYVAQNNLGVWEMHHGSPESARQHFATALLFNPIYGPAHNNLGLILADDGKWSDAAHHLEVALRTNSDLPGTHDALGRVLTELGRLSEGEACFRAALRLNPNDADAHNNLGINLKRQGRLAEALAEYRECLRLQPRHADALGNAAAVLLQQGHLPAAQNDLESLLRLQPADAATCNSLGVVLELQGKYTEAARRYAEAIAFNPRVAVYRANLAFALYQQGHTEAAAKQFEAAEQLDPHWPEAARQAAWRLATSPQNSARNGALALRFARLACARAASEPISWDVLAAAYAELGRYRDATQAARQAVALATPKQPELARELAQRLSLYQEGRPFRSSTEVP